MIMNSSHFAGRESVGGRVLRQSLAVNSALVAESLNHAKP